MLAYNFFFLLIIFFTAFNTYIAIRTFKPRFLFKSYSKEEIKIIHENYEKDIKLSRTKLKEILFKNIGKTKKQIVIDKIATYVKNILKFLPLLILAFVNIGYYLIYSFSIIFSFLISKGCKKFIKKTRPDKLNNRSFPSGHTVSAFTGSSFILFLYGLNFFTFILLSLAFFVAFSRLYSNRHSTIDIVGGVIFGFFSGFLVPFIISITLK